MLARLTFDRGFPHGGFGGGGTVLLCEIYSASRLYNTLSKVSSHGISFLPLLSPLFEPQVNKEPSQFWEIRAESQISAFVKPVLTLEQTKGFFLSWASGQLSLDLEAKQSRTRLAFGWGATEQFDSGGYIGKLKITPEEDRSGQAHLQVHLQCC